MRVASSEQTTVWVNGVFSSSSTIPVSPYAPGLTVGLGVFDSLCGYDGQPFDFPKHYKRLADGALKLGLEAPPQRQIYQALLGVMEKNGFTCGKCRLRITLLAGLSAQQNIVTVAAAPERAPLSTCVTAEARVNEFSHLTGVKSTSYASNMIALQRALKAGADEAVMLNTRGLLCEGATSNIFLVKEGELLTPALESGCLPGVARNTVIELCGQLGIAVQQCALTLDDLQTAEEAFLTSSLREVQPIESLDGKVFPHILSDLTESLQAAYLQRVHHGAE